MDKIDIEQYNRENFRTLLDSLSMPGKTTKLNKVFDSYTLSLASVLLYSEVSYLNTTDEDFSIIDAITNPKKDNTQNADYIFCNNLNSLLQKVKKGTYLSPEHSATIICSVDSFDGITLNLKGPGIDVQKKQTYPVNKDFVKSFNENNKEFPLGNEIVFINKQSGELKSLCRTTKLELI
ncbi:MAG: phosphonate C-P lyase system protein PhnH [Halarcobacter sp.]